jgi:DHA1 family quinolone resistance protein-like MFS transporter
MAGSFCVGMFGNLASIPLSRMLGQRYALVAGLFKGLSSVLLIILTFQGTVIRAIGLFWLVYVSSSIGMSPHSALFNKEVPKEQRSSMLSLESLVTYGGAFLGSVVLGYLAENTSIAAAWAVAGAVMAFSTLVYIQVDRRLALEKRGDGRKESSALRGS